MPVCAICEEVVDEVYRCADCGIAFCKDCGDPNPEKKLCAICMAIRRAGPVYSSDHRFEEEEWEEEEW